MTSFVPHTPDYPSLLLPYNQRSPYCNFLPGRPFDASVPSVICKSFSVTDFVSAKQLFWPPVAGIRERFHAWNCCYGFAPWYAFCCSWYWNLGMNRDGWGSGPTRRVLHHYRSQKSSMKEHCSNPSDFIDWKVSAADPKLFSRQHLEIKRQYTLDQRRLFYARSANPNGQAYPAPIQAYKRTELSNGSIWEPVASCCRF